MVGFTFITARTRLETSARESTGYCECVGGTRFIGVYLARQLVEQGHEVTLLTRGKSPVTQQIPDDTDESFAKYQAAVKHIACDRKDAEAVKDKISSAGFQGELHLCCKDTHLSHYSSGANTSYVSGQVVNITRADTAPPAHHIW